MKIVVRPNMMLRLQTIGVANRGIEFSGLGFCQIKGNIVDVYDFVLLDLGSEVWTEIQPELILPLLERSDAGNLKVWVHAHPMGDGVPGRHNWSGIDEATIQENPLGGVPEMVQWSVSLVRTPRGWVGRIDNHLKKTTLHLPVEPQEHIAYSLVDEIRARKKSAEEVAVVPQEIQDVVARFGQAELDELGISREELEDLLLEELMAFENDLAEEDDRFIDSFGYCPPRPVSVSYLPEGRK